ncbi:ATP-grasp domain-containing protein [Patescibacteria group bacterium]|nr:ATP-grasp domain-containing protein [Patescibacteria group bacterium]
MIKDLKTLKEFTKENVNFPVFGAGVYPFHRLGPEDFLPDYRIIALRRSLDGELIKKDIRVVSIEKSIGTKHIREPRNATTVIIHAKTKKYLDKFKRKDILVYKASTKMEKTCEENNWNLIASPTRFGKNLFENKITFKKQLQDLGISVPPGKMCAKEKLHYGHLLNAYGLPFVIQHPTKGGGKGTFFINSKEDFDKAYLKLEKPTRETFEGEVEEKPTDEVIVAKYIKGPSPSLTVCITKHGIISTGLQYQVLDIPELYNPEKGSGLFCGHDWTNSNFSENIQKQAYEITEKVGNLFKQNGYKGIFGLDFVMDEKEEKLYVVEANPRMLGSFPVLTMSQIISNTPPILAFHILEYLNIDYNIDINEINRLMRQKEKGSQMIMHNLLNRWSRIHKTVKPGIYQLDKNGKPKYLRPGYKLEHLKNKNEFAVVEGILIKKSHLSPNRRICRIISLNGVLENYKELTPWAKTVAQEMYKEFKIKRIRFIKLKKLFNPHFLAKG